MKELEENKERRQKRLETMTVNEITDRKPISDEMEFYDYW